MRGDHFVDAWLESAARGWRVVPLHSVENGVCSCHRPGCRPAGKHPRIEAWPKGASTDRAQIEAWARRWPDANLGVATGRGSGLVVLDVDPRNGGDDYMRELEKEYGQLPQTVRSHTGGGGEHIFFESPPSALESFDLSPGVEVKAEGKLVAVPPSVHASGRAYEWDVDRHPEEVPLAGCPTWLLEARARQSARSPTLPIEGPIPEGHRNATLTRIAGRIRMAGVPLEGVRAALAAINEHRCQPPLPESELTDIVRSASGWEGLPWLISPREFFTDERLRSTARLVLQAVCEHADHEGVAYPGYDRLKARTGIKSDATLRGAIAELEAAGRLLVTGRPRNSNLYRVTNAFSAHEGAFSAETLVLREQILKNGGAPREGAMAA